MLDFAFIDVAGNLDYRCRAICFTHVEEEESAAPPFRLQPAASPIKLYKLSCECSLQGICSLLY